MSIKLKQPYKIIQHKQKRYEDHYHIPSNNCVVIPIKQYGDDLSCDVRWEDATGQQLQLKDLFFSQQNIVPLDPLKDFKLHELWEHYYAVSANPAPQGEGLA